jgi:small GTP-binding protein
MSNIKCVILGDSCVGKTSIMNRYSTGKFCEKTDTTLGAVFFTQKVHVDDNFIGLDFWDTAGQERYRSLLPMYLRGANIIIIVYDINNLQSFNSLEYWIDSIKYLNNFKLFIVGNKSDLSNKISQSLKDKLFFSMKYDFYHLEVSAKSNDNIDELIKQITNTAIKLDIFRSSTLDVSGVDLHSVQKENIIKQNCCNS